MSKENKNRFEKQEEVKEDENVMKAIRKIVDKGCDVEIRKSKTGKLKVIEVKKNTAAL